MGLPRFTRSRGCGLIQCPGAGEAEAVHCAVIQPQSSMDN